MTTILITGIGGDIAQSIATILRTEFPQWRVLGCDVHDRHGGSLVTDHCFIAPTASSGSLDAWLLELFDRESVDLCLPTSEAELRHFLAGNTRQIGRVPLLMANEKAILVGCDKLATARHLVNAGCPAPWTVPADDVHAPEVTYPCIFKPRRSAGSKGIFVCASSEEAAFHAARQTDAVLQELLLPADQEVTCAIYRTRDGRTATLQLLRRLNGGFTGWAQVIRDEAVELQCLRLAQSLDLRGAINVQLRITANGPRVFEINPRFSSTVLMRHLLGFRDLMWALQEARGMQVKFSYPRLGAVAVRTQSCAVLDGTNRELPC
jgi:carbamoyl-phosphate synthase large subunit